MICVLLIGSQLRLVFHATCFYFSGFLWSLNVGFLCLKPSRFKWFPSAVFQFDVKALDISNIYMEKYTYVFIFPVIYLDIYYLHINQWKGWGSILQFVIVKIEAIIECNVVSTGKEMWQRGEDDLFREGAVSQCSKCGKGRSNLKVAYLGCNRKIQLGRSIP